MRFPAGLKPAWIWETGFAATVDWYLSHRDWVDQVRSGECWNWISTQYGARPPTLDL